MHKPFEIAPTPQFYFGAGKRALLPTLLKPMGKSLLLVTGKESLTASAPGKELVEILASTFRIRHFFVGEEPTPLMIDTAVASVSSSTPDVVVAIGGGSVIDAGKAISAMIPLQEVVKDFLEGVGSKKHPGLKIPFIALPTTAGTGSEATKNSVLSEVGENGFKRSLRHNRFVPDVAIVDPELTLSCPRAVTATSGMDAFTQLLESFVSVNSNVITDALAFQGLRCVANGLLKAYHDPGDLAARSEMALAAYLSGVTLANAGLGLVHGFASSVGGAFPISHGVICSSTMHASNVATIRKLRKGSTGAELAKFARAGEVISEKSGESTEFYVDFLLDFILRCATEMNIPRLSQCGFERASLEKIARQTDNKYNPAQLNDEERAEVLHMSF